MVWLFSGVWFLLTTLLTLLMYASQVGPDEAVSKLYLWAQKFGIEDPPQWLKDKSANRKVRGCVAIALAILLFAGGAMSAVALMPLLPSAANGDASASASHPPSSPGLPSPAQRTATLPRPTILSSTRYYSTQNKEEISGRLDKISDAINRADKEMLLPANRVLIQRFLARPAQEAQAYLNELDGIKSAAKSMDSQLYDDLLAKERDYRSEINAILFPKDPFVNFMLAADEYRNGIAVWMKVGNGISDDETRRAFDRLVLSSARSFGIARDAFVKWLTERQELIERARRDLRS